MGLPNDTQTTNRDYSICPLHWIHAIILTEIGMPSARTVVQGQRNENQELERHLDSVDEARENAAIQMESYQQIAIAYYNRKARLRAFRTVTLVLKKVFENTVERRTEKL